MRLIACMHVAMFMHAGVCAYLCVSSCARCVQLVLSIFHSIAPGHSEGVREEEWMVSILPGQTWSKYSGCL